MLIVPFEVADRDPRAVWLGEAAAVLLGDALRAMQLPALTRAERVRAFEEANLPTAGRLSLASLVRVGHLVLASDLDRRHRAPERARSWSSRPGASASTPAAWSSRRPTARRCRELFALHERLARRLMGSSRPPAARPRPAAAAGGRFRSAPSRTTSRG